MAMPLLYLKFQFIGRLASKFIQGLFSGEA